MILFKKLLTLFFAALLLISLDGCASKRNARNMKPCDCPEFDHKPTKRKKHSSIMLEKKYWYKVDRMG